MKLIKVRSAMSKGFKTESDWIWHQGRLIP